MYLGKKEEFLRWPYTEGLTIDEAMHPLTFMAVGIYGKELLNQNGAPNETGHTMEVWIQKHKIYK